MIRPRDLFKAAARYVQSNPQALVRAAVDLTALRFGIPLAALRWAVAQGKPGKRAPKDVEIGSSPPALRLGATLDAMGTPVRIAAAVRVDGVTLAPGSLRIAIRLSDVKLTLAGESDSPVATLIKSGALDLSKPGNLVKFIPKRPAMIVEAEGDRIVIDVMKMPKLAKNRRLGRLLSALAPVLGVRAVETEGDQVVIALRATPDGIRSAIRALRAH